MRAVAAGRTLRGRKEVAVTVVPEQELARIYRARRSPELVDVPDLAFAMIDGHGDPNVSAAYRAALQALFSVSYALKFAVKREGGPAYRVGPPEGLWSMPDMARFATASKSEWDWTMMIRQPAAVTPELFERMALDATRAGRRRSG
jgi:hypothetical protein